jgi:hypothetical protein
MLTIQKIDTTNKAQVQRFVHLPFQFYTDCPQWVPPILLDVTNTLDHQKHPYYEHSDADFFIAVRDGRDVGRIAALENRNYNQYHGTKKAQFYFFECEDDMETAKALFERLFEWSRARGLDTVIGNKGFGALDGYGILVEGFEHRQLMNMMNYNHPYIPHMLEALGFEKEVDFVSCYINTATFHMPDRIKSIAERVEKRGTLAVKRFKDKKELVSWAPRIGQAYNKAFIHNWEYAPLTEREIKFVTDTIMTIADPNLIKIITHNDDVVGFLLGFHDLSAALQRSRGRLLPFGLIDLLLEKGRTNWIALNGAGILPEFQGRGGNALLYNEVEKTISGSQFEHADLTQVAESAVQMRQDLINLGGKPYKNHRVYHKAI